VTVTRSTACNPVAAIVSISSLPSGDVQADADDDARGPRRFRAQLDEDAAELAVAHENVIRPLQADVGHVERAQRTQHADADGETERPCVSRDCGERPAQRQTDRAAGWRKPGTTATAATGRLELCEQHLRPPLHGIGAYDELGVGGRRGPRDIEARKPLFYVGREVLANLRGGQRLARAPAVCSRDCARPPSACRDRATRLPLSHGAASDTECLRKVLAGVKRSVAQLREYACNER